MPELLSNLPVKICEQVRKTSCNLIFRFGNHQTLPSRTALLLPLRKTWIRIAIVQGNTSFLLSSSFLKHIKAVIDTEQGTLWSKLLNCNLPIEQSNKNLFLLDINNLWTTQESNESCPEVHQAGVCETEVKLRTSELSERENTFAEQEGKADSGHSIVVQDSHCASNSSLKEIQSLHTSVESAVRKSESMQVESYTQEPTRRDQRFKFIWELPRSAERLRQPCRRCQA